MEYMSQLKIDVFYSLTFMLKMSFNEKNVINHQRVWVFDFGVIFIFIFINSSIFFGQEHWQNKHIVFKNDKKYLTFYILPSDLYGNRIYLQGERKDGNSPFLNDFSGEMTFFNKAEDEPSTYFSKSIYIRTTYSNSTLMESSQGNARRTFLCYIM